MADKSPELVSKTKFVINEDSFFSAPREEEGFWIGAPPYWPGASSFVSSVFEDVDGMAYFSSDTVDKSLVVLGRNWDFAQRVPGMGRNLFSNNWTPPRVFHNQTVIMQECGQPEEVEGEGSWGLTGANITQKIVLKTSVPYDSTDLPTFTGDNEPPYTGIRPTMYDWLSYTKAGLVSGYSGKTYNPLVQTNKWFFDHFHEAINPFTPSELEGKQPSGKTFFANFKTYYNERLDSADFEALAGSFPGKENSLPSLYGFLRLLQNNSVGGDQVLNLSTKFHELTDYYEKKPTKLPFLYTEGLKKYPLEALVTLYNIIGHQTLQTSPWMSAIEGGLEPGEESFLNTKIIEKILSLDFDKFDATGLFSSYYREWVDQVISAGPPEVGAGELFSAEEQNAGGLLLGLDNIMTNLVFSPDSLKFLNKADQYKKHFPFYAELEFTANLLAPLGDAMKRLHMTKFTSDVIVSSLFRERGVWHATWTARGFSSAMPGDVTPLGVPTFLTPIVEGKFIDYSQENIYKDLSSLDLESAESILAPAHEKTVVNISTILENWLNDDVLFESQGVYVGAHEPTTDFSTGDPRNYTTYFRDSYSEQIDMNSDENFIFKKLFGAAFHAKILELYKKHRRTYQDILDGKPAYTEDLFYRVEKLRKGLEEGAEYEAIQNILIPNTSELDIVKYVDTQLKYSDYATYKYNVYAHRIVFGSRYRYFWTDPGTGQEISATIQKLQHPADDPYSALMVNEYGAGLLKTDNSFSTDFSAAYTVELEPSVLIIGDKIFSTPEIIIMDKPPVIPDVNIVPYRAVNNRIKILITGATDRYRATPVLMLDSDEAEFERIKAAQLVVDSSGSPLEDGKVEFGSDDPVRRFQIFRTQKKPLTYADFELYEQINEEFFEEQILPNTKYYYTFRAIDDHNHVSNPTPVYEVELIDEKGAVKPIIRLVDMAPPKTNTNIKDFQKYFYLKPSANQIFFSEDESVDAIFSDELKKKKYKIRLTSKGTGKKIDINFSFKKKIQ